MAIRSMVDAALKALSCPSMRCIRAFGRPAISPEKFSKPCSLQVLLPGAELADVDGAVGV